MRAPPTTLYVHVPWCVRKCPYCDFNSHPLHGALPQAAYVEALLRDLDRQLERTPCRGREIEAVFIGGGTPSLLEPGAVAALLEGIGARLALDAAVEITLEANPGTLERVRLRGFRAAGVNRLSIGVQSFDDACLRALGRIHDGAQARAAIEAARGAGFERINVDLMFGVPGQSVAQARADLAQACAFAPDHLSWYQLTIEPDTVFARHPPVLPGEAHIEAMRAAGLADLAGGGYEHYEISAHAQPGAQCRHNCNYWTYGDYLGIGAGAHGKWTDPDTGRIVRYAKRKSPAHYLRQAGTDAVLEQEGTVGADERALEFLMNALRLRAGFAPAWFEARTGLAFAHIGAALEEAAADGLVMQVQGRWCATEHGWRFLDELLLRLVPRPLPAAAYG